MATKSQILDELDDLLMDIEILIDRRIMLMQHSAMKSNLNYNTGV